MKAVTGSPQGRCATTLTERFVNLDCTCDTYPDNLGPCKGYEEGGRVGHCVYCDHTPACHLALLVSA